MGGAHLLLRPGGDHCIDPSIDPLIELRTLHHEADEQRRVAHLAGPQLGALGLGIELSRVEQFERPDDPLAVAGIDLVGGPRSSLTEHAVERRRSAAFELGQPALPRPFGRRRPEAQLGQRSTQV